MRINKLFLFALLLPLLYCTVFAVRVPKGSAEAALVLPDGFRVRAELALDPEAQSKGLMFRKELPGDRGMLFVFSKTEPRGFWMKNTFIDLDMVFLDGDLKVLKVFHRVPRSSAGQPESEVARVTAPAACVLELAAGTARAHRVKPGSKIKISFPLPAPEKKKKTARPSSLPPEAMPD
ncbi:MAG: hypothetical protein AUJ51_13050 [Elusimicrobia bacterium CG1_02_56_21]|nr:MAG: hypothetical protein AUJ51_13050 [Elusimicrobia bacterium CG1_02_56_21]